MDGFDFAGPASSTELVESARGDARAVGLVGLIGVGPSREQMITVDGTVREAALV